jgi:hypothetical protein
MDRLGTVEKSLVFLEIRVAFIFIAVAAIIASGDFILVL